MRIDAIKIGDNPPDDVNVIVEVPVGGKWRKCSVRTGMVASALGKARKFELLRAIETRLVSTQVGKQSWFRGRGAECRHHSGTVCDRVGIDVRHRFDQPRKTK